MDLDAETLERWRFDDDRPEVLSELLIWRLEGSEPFELDLVAFFEALRIDQ